MSKTVICVWPSCPCTAKGQCQGTGTRAALDAATPPDHLVWEAGKLAEYIEEFTYRTSDVEKAPKIIRALIALATAQAAQIAGLTKERDDLQEKMKLERFLTDRATILAGATQDEAATLRAEVERLRGAGIEAYYTRQMEWSRETFGPALRTKGIIDHITKELREIAADPHDLSEWIDVVILAMDGFWRHGGKPEDLMPALLAKQAKNMARTWPDWRGMSEDAAIEHDRSKDAAEALEGKA